MVNEKIKIALMSYSMDKRVAKGTALYTRRLIENMLGDDRFDFYLVHYEKVDDPLYVGAKEIIMPRVKLPYGSHFIRQLLFFWKFRNNKFDIIHWFQPRVYPFFWLAPAKKIVITTFGAGEITAPGPWIFSREVFNFVLKKFNRKVDAMIAVSKYGSEEISKFYHALSERVYFTYLGGGEHFKMIDKTAAGRLIAEKYKLTQPFILQMARHLPHKNIDTMIKAYAILKKEYNGKEKLLVVGTKDYDSQKIFRLAEESGYKNEIIFIDYIEPEDLNYLYSAAQILVMPSLQEGFGLPVVEAMASGTPVITSNTTSLPEVAGDAALLVNPADPKAIAEAMNKILTDDNLRARLAEKGVARSKKFTWSQTGDKTKEIYLKII